MDKDHAKTIPISEILDKLNRKAHRFNQTKALYHSPLHIDEPLSFWVYSRTNRWHDYKLGKGGDLLDLAQRYLKFTKEHHTPVDALRWVTNLSSHRLMQPVYAPIDLAGEQELVQLLFKSRQPLTYIGLVHYLEKQFIPVSIAQSYLHEIKVHNLSTKRDFLALGFKNEQGGFELKNPFFEGAIGERAISFVRGPIAKPSVIHVFQNFLDFLSILGQLPDHRLKSDVLILHSLVLLPQASAYLQDYGYRTLYSWLDNDPLGEQATQTLGAFSRTQDSLRHVSMNNVYASHPNVRTWHRHACVTGP
jgi:hypothetical protein